MNVNPLIMQLKDVIECPVVPDIYQGTSDKWITFTYADEKGELFADDDEQYTTVKLYVSYYCPHTYNYMEDKHSIRSALVSYGFQIESISSELDDSLEGVDFVRRVLFIVNYTGITI